MVNLLQFDRSALGDWCEQQGEPAFRATQLFRWIHQRGERDFAAMSNLAKPFRDKLVAHAEVARCRSRASRSRSDGTVKWLFDVGGGDAVETVFIPEARPRHLVHLVAGRLRRQLPLLRDRPSGLQPQPLDGRDRRASSGTPSSSCAGASRCAAGERAITNVVMMGMGEPLQNYGALVPALRTMLDDHG